MVKKSRLKRISSEHRQESRNIHLPGYYFNKTLHSDSFSLESYLLTMTNMPQTGTAKLEKKHEVIPSEDGQSGEDDGEEGGQKPMVVAVNEAGQNLPVSDEIPGSPLSSALPTSTDGSRPTISAVELKSERASFKTRDSPY